MTIKTVTCIVLTCDTCGHTAHQDDREVRYLHVDEAKADGWILTGGIFDRQTVRCGPCEAKLGCQQNGHDWTAWVTLATGDRIRDCRVCGNLQSVAPAQVAVGARLQAEHMQHLKVGAIVTIDAVDVPYPNDDSKVWYTIPQRIMEKVFPDGWLVSGTVDLQHGHQFLDAPMTIVWLPGEDLLPNMDTSLSGPDYDQAPVGAVARSELFERPTEPRRAMLKTREGWAVAGEVAVQQPNNPSNPMAELVALPDITCAI